LTAFRMTAEGWIRLDFAEGATGLIRLMAGIC
jgi:hypothetical protein